MAYRTVSAIKVITARRKFLWFVVAVAGYPVTIAVAAKVFRPRIPVRREGADASEPPGGSVDLRFRNPRWAKVTELAKVAEAGYEPSLCVDGTPDLLASQVGGSRQLPKVGTKSQRFDVWLLPFATYHVDELGPVIRDLGELGLRAALVFAAQPTAAQLSVAGAYTNTVFLADELLNHPPAVAVSMMDWGPADPIRQRLLAAGTEFLSKVEGAQDFRNLDTPRWEFPYSRSTCVLAQGSFDVSNVNADAVEIVGGVRIERTLHALERDEIELIHHGPLVNLNFSYGTYEAWLRPWHFLAHRAIAAAGKVGATSVHPAVVAPWARHRTRWPLALELETSSHLVTRASTALFDALVIGRPAIYFNPHGERVWRSVGWNEYVPRVRTVRELNRALTHLDPSDISQISKRQEWVRSNFLSIDVDRPASLRVAEVVARWADVAPN